MIHFSKISPFETIYTFIDNRGRNINIASARLRRHCLQTNPEVVSAPIDEKLVQTFLSNNCISLARVNQLSTLDLIEPAILCRYGSTNGAPDVYFVDGHHRYVRLWRDGYKFFPLWLLEPKVWQPFQIKGLPPQTKEDLRNFPTLQPHHQEH